MYVPDGRRKNENDLNRKHTTPNDAENTPQKYHRLSQRALALEVLLPLVQDVAEMQGSKDLEMGAVPEMREEDHSLLDRLEKRRALVKRSISDMTSQSFGSIFRSVAQQRVLLFFLVGTIPRFFCFFS